MRTWAFVGQKGGISKTTLCVQLAVYAWQAGERVLVVDLDPQESATRWHAKRSGDKESPAVMPALPENLPKMLDAAATLGITLTLVDTAPATDAGALAAIRAADLIITPTQPDFFEIEALKSTTDLISRTGKMDQAICVVSCIDFHSQKQAEQDFKDAEMQARALGIAVAPVYVVRRRPFKLSIRDGKAVTEYKPKDAKAVKDIQDLWQHLNTLNPIRTLKTERAKA